MSYFETLISLSTALIFAQVFQIILTCMLAFAFSHFMTVLHCSIPTTAGLLAGFITLPTIVQVKTAQIKLQSSRKLGFSIWYKRLAICTCTILQSVSFSLTLVNLFSFKTCQDTFMEIMHDYGNKQSSKSIVDNVQWFMQCCGASKYNDWYDINWGNFIVDPFHPKRKKAIEQLLIGDTDDYPDLSTVRNDAVPFSCCAEVASSGCIHQNLEQFGTYTINSLGCGHQLDSINCTVLIMELIVYTIGLIIELMMLYYLCKPHYVYDKNYVRYEKIPSRIRLKSFHSSEKKEFSKFLNDNSSSAQLTEM